MVKKILVALDGSAPSLAAMEEAAALALGLHVPIVLVAAVSPMPVPPMAVNPVMTIPGDAVAGAVEAMETYYRTLITDNVAALKARGLTVEGRVVDGPPVDAILDLAASSGADLIVVGSRGLGLTKRIVLGSVSTALVTHAPCAVLVVRGPAPATA